MKKFILLLCAGILISISVSAIPAKPNRFVNDYTNTLTKNDQSVLEQQLQAYSDTSQNQICVVIVDDLEGKTPAEYAQEIGQSWGVGQKDKDNGVIILVKPKQMLSKGEVFIATGYGVEECLTDALCKRIIERIMIPQLKNGNYYKAISNAIVEIQKVLVNESRLQKKPKPYMIILLLVIIVVIVLFVCINDDSTHSGSSGYHIYGSHNDSSGFGGFNGGIFGGGSFGGGGASGSF